MAEGVRDGFVDAQELADRKRVALHAGGWVWLAELAMDEPKPVCEIGLDPAAAVKLFDFLLLHADRLLQWRNQQGSL